MSDYLTRILRAHAAGAFKPGELVVLDVIHDPACPRPHGGPCTCQPDMTATTGESHLDIDTQGTPTQGSTT